MRNRPVGVTILSLFDVLGGISLLWVGLSFFPYFPLMPLVVLSGLFTFYVAIQLWTGKTYKLLNQVLAYYFSVFVTGGVYLTAYAPPSALVLQEAVFLLSLVLGGPAIARYWTSRNLQNQ